MSEKRHSISELNQLFTDGDTADHEIFAEQRSNIQLIAGEHYAKKGHKLWERLRFNRDFTTDQKIRLTKNHIRKIVLTYRNSITSYAPGVQARAKDKASMQHQKAAELVNAVWEDGKNRHDFNKQINLWASDFIGIGEVAVKIFFDPSRGKFLGMQAQVDENGQVTLDEMGQLIPSEIAKFNGDVIIERIFGFNIIRPAGIKSMKEANWLCHRKMVKVSELKILIDMSETLSDEEKQKIKQKITEGPDQTFVILDGNTGQYKTVKDQTMLKEFFFKPCPQYPMGYFYICTESDKIFEGELPFGKFPIVIDGFDEVQTSPRARSIVKQLRPNQVEINRCASTIAEHQITMGWDKVLIQNGTKLSPGVAFPGVRSFSYSGKEPVVMEGRTGNQYLEYMQSQISEMYQIANIDEVVEEKQNQYDVYSMLSRSIKDKKKFSVYTDTFESFLKEVFETYVFLCQKYYTPQHLIPAIGKSEYINMDEFKGAENICYSIVLDAQCDDSETKLGKQLMLNHIIQYVGPQLAQKDIGKLIRLMPYANDEQILEDLTMDFDFAENLMLALDRGKPAVVNPYVKDPSYVINKLTSRTTKPDFDLVHPMIKQLYQQAIQAYERVQADQQMKIKQAQSEFIPTGGYLVACDFYVPDPNNPEKLPKRVRVPSESIDWLLKQLNTQGSSQQNLDNLSKGAVGDISQMLMEKLRLAGGNPMMPMNGQTNPGGMRNGY